MLVHWLHSVRRDAVPVPRVDPDVIEATHTAELGEEGGNGVDVTETHPLSVALQPLGPMLDRVGAEQRPGLTQYGNEPGSCIHPLCPRDQKRRAMPRLQPSVPSSNLKERMSPSTRALH